MTIFSPRPAFRTSSHRRAGARASAVLLAGFALSAVLLHAAIVPPGVLPPDKPHPAPPIDPVFAVEARAARALQEGRVDDAVTLLSPLLATHPADATAHQLLCRVYYAQNMADQAIQQCTLAFGGERPNSPQASEDQMWLGRAYGYKADHANPIQSYSLAKKVRAAFELSVQLNPNNVAAASDLGEYYVAAPYFLGGGLDRAQALAARIMPHFPFAAHRLLALIAQDGKDSGTAEAEFKRAVDSSRDPGTAAASWIDLARFYARHSRPADTVRAIRSAIDADHINNRSSDAAMVDAAGILTEAHLEPELAERLLRDYLDSPAKSDAAPAFKVHVQLSRLLARRGDKNGAQAELVAASALASSFANGGRSVMGL